MRSSTGSSRAFVSGSERDRASLEPPYLRRQGPSFSFVFHVKHAAAATPRRSRSPPHPPARWRIPEAATELRPKRSTGCGCRSGKHREASRRRSGGGNGRGPRPRRAAGGGHEQHLAEHVAGAEPHRPFLEIDLSSTGSDRIDRIAPLAAADNSLPGGRQSRPKRTCSFPSAHRTTRRAAGLGPRAHPGRAERRPRALSDAPRVPLGGVGSVQAKGVFSVETLVTLLFFQTERHAGEVSFRGRFPVREEPQPARVELAFQAFEPYLANALGRFADPFAEEAPGSAALETPELLQHPTPDQELFPALAEPVGERPCRAEPHMQPSRRTRRRIGLVSVSLHVPIAGHAILSERIEPCTARRVRSAPVDRAIVASARSPTSSSLSQPARVGAAATSLVTGTVVAQLRRRRRVRSKSGNRSGKSSLTGAAARVPSGSRASPEGRQPLCAMPAVLPGTGRRAPGHRRARTRPE